MNLVGENTISCTFASTLPTIASEYPFTPLPVSCSIQILTAMDSVGYAFINFVDVSSAPLL